MALFKMVLNFINSLFRLQIFRKLLKNLKESNLDISRSAILSRVIGEICSTQNRAHWTHNKCLGLQLQPKEFVDPIPNENKFYYYDPAKLEITMRLIQNATLIHATKYENLENDKWQQIDTDNAFRTIYKRNCPQAYADSEYFF